MDENIAWREARDKRCRDPNGWLSLAGLHWLADGDQNTIGSHESCSIRFEVSPLLPHVGTITLDSKAQTLSFRCAPSAAGAVLVDDKPADPTHAVALSFDEKTPTRVKHDDSLTWFVVKRGERFAIRLRNSRNPVLVNFHGIDSWPINLDYRVHGKFIAYDPPRELAIPNAVGGVDKELSKGYVEFTLQNQTLTLQTVDEGISDLFVVFADQTTGKQTYGGGRMLYCKPPDLDGNVIIDFNQAYNPPCVFTPWCTCPLPLKENRLPVAIEAGEKKFGDH